MEKTIREHLKDLRKQLMIILFPTILLFGSLFYVSPLIVNLLLGYLNLSAVTLAPMEGISTQIQIAASLTFVFILPLIGMAIYNFVKSELSIKLRRSILKYVGLSYLLGIVGITFSLAYFSKFLLAFFIEYNIVNPMWSIKAIVSFLVSFAVTFALVMQIIIVLPLLNKLGIFDVGKLKGLRLPILVGMLIVSALITPPDIISQVLMVLPIYGSFELGMLFCKNRQVIKNDRTNGNIVDSCGDRFNSIIRQENYDKVV